MQKNINAAKPHAEARENFINNVLKGYNWEVDKDKLKPIIETAQPIPN